MAWATRTPTGRLPLDAGVQIKRHASRLAHRGPLPWLASAGLRLALLLVLSACAPAVVRHNQAGNKRFDGSAYADAIGEYRLAQVAEPDLAEPYYNAANAYNRTSQIGAALAQTKQALKTADAALATQAWYNLGNAYFDAEQWPTAIEAYQEALRLQPDDADAKHNLELALQQLEEQQQQQRRQEDGQPEDEGQEAKADRSEGQGDEQATPQPSNIAEASGTPEQVESMTPEQAIQLLEALVNDSQTLQERLQKMHQVPGPSPERDW